jgi:Flp pilus assembly pilin Flp
MLLRLYVKATTRIAAARARVTETAAREDGNAMLEYAILAAVVLAVLAVGVLLLANAGSAQANATSGGINAIPVGNFNP